VALLKRMPRLSRPVPLLQIDWIGWCVHMHLQFKQQHYCYMVLNPCNSNSISQINASVLQVR